MKNINSKEIILESALTLFSEKGYEGAGISEIVQMAGVTKPTLYYFFHSKEGLFQELLNQYYRRLNLILTKESVYTPNAESYHDDVFPVLLRIAYAYFNFARDNKNFYMMILSLAYAPPTAQVTAIINPYNVSQYEIINKCFEKIAETHTNIKGKELLCAYHFVAMINANIGFWNHGYANLNEQQAKAVVHQFMHGIFA
jgi:AcrR family transcriptional regulator